MKKWSFNYKESAGGFFGTPELTDYAPEVQAIMAVIQSSGAINGISDLPMVAERLAAAGVVAPQQTQPTQQAQPVQPAQSMQQPQQGMQ